MSNVHAGILFVSKALTSILPSLKNVPIRRPKIDFFTTWTNLCWFYQTTKAIQTQIRELHSMVLPLLASPILLSGCVFPNSKYEFGAGCQHLWSNEKWHAFSGGAWDCVEAKLTISAISARNSMKFLNFGKLNCPHFLHLFNQLIAATSTAIFVPRNPALWADKTPGSNHRSGNKQRRCSFTVR